MRRRRIVLSAAVAPLASAAPQAARWALPGLLAGPAAAQGAEPAAAVQWPSITLLDGSTLSPASWQGLAAVVVFWATWCPYCRRHNAHIDKLHRASAGLPLRVLGVAVDGEGPAVRQHMASQGHAFPVTLDGGRLRPLLTPRTLIPMTIALDRQQRVRLAVPGEMSEDDVLGLQRLLLRPAA